MKKLLFNFCIFVLMFSLISCTNGNIDNQEIETGQEIETQDITNAPEDEEEMFEMDPTTYFLNSSTKGIKVLGERCLAASNQLNCDWTGSGVEMNIKHAGGDIIFSASATSNCYFRAYVDGAEYRNGDVVYYTVGTSPTQIVLKDVPYGEHHIKLIKVTGYTIARAQLYSVRFAGLISENAPEDKDIYIEFVGDSICCAWGTIGNKQGAYTDQDGTFAYPLLVSEELNADYSVTALSGQGLLCGEPGMKKGYLYESAMRTTEVPYDFARKADIVVINVGTNDYTYQKTYDIDEAKFKESYLSFLQTVAEKNGDDCIILCLYNCMNDTFGKAIVEAVREFGGTSKNTYCIKMTRGNSGGAGHPDIAEQAGYAKYLADAIKEEFGDKLGFN